MTVGKTSAPQISVVTANAATVTRLATNHLTNRFHLVPTLRRYAPDYPVRPLAQVSHIIG
jgi:hypothetical protein